VVKRHVLYLGEISPSQASVWRKYRPASPVGDAAMPAAAMERVLAAGQLWSELPLDAFRADRLPANRKGTRWDQVLQVLVSYRLISPGSEWKLHRDWFGRSPVADLLGSDFRLADRTNSMPVMTFS